MIPDNAGIMKCLDPAIAINGRLRGNPTEVWVKVDLESGPPSGVIPLISVPSFYTCTRIGSGSCRMNWEGIDQLRYICFKRGGERNSESPGVWC